MKNMINKNLPINSNWDISKGDYRSENVEYDELYRKGIKRDKVVRNAIWFSTAIVTLTIYINILSYFASH
jgi:hypothetical protein